MCVCAAVPVTIYIYIRESERALLVGPWPKEHRRFFSAISSLAPKPLDLLLHPNNENEKRWKILINFPFNRRRRWDSGCAFPTPLVIRGVAETVLGSFVPSIFVSSSLFFSSFFFVALANAFHYGFRILTARARVHCTMCHNSVKPCTNGMCFFVCIFFLATGSLTYNIVNVGNKFHCI